MYNYLKADLYLINMMLDHVKLLKNTVGQEIDIDYMIELEHIAYNIREISDEAKRTFPELDWTCVSKFRDLITYEVYHFKPGDKIETVSDEMLLMADRLPQLRNTLSLEVENANTNAKEN